MGVATVRSNDPSRLTRVLDARTRTIGVSSAVVSETMPFEEPHWSCEIVLHHRYEVLN